MSKLRILLLLHSLSLNGAPKIALEALGLSSSDVEVLTIAETGGPRESACRRLGDFVSLNGMSFGPLSLLSRVRRRTRIQKVVAQVKAFRPDVVYANSVASLPLLRVLGYLADTTTPVVLHVHELRSYQQRYLQLEKAGLTERPNQYIAVSDAVRDALQNDCGVKPSRINVIPAFVPSMADWPDLKRSTAPAKSADTRFVVGGAGFPVWIKGSTLWVQIVAETVRLMEGDSVRFKYVGIGDEEYSWQMQEMARKLGVDKHIEWVKTTPDALRHFEDFDCFVSSSWEDPCPITVLENMRIGNPVLCFAGSGGAPFEVGDTGIVVPDFSPGKMAQAIAGLAADPDRRARLGNAARERIKMHFTDVVQAPRIMEVLRRAASQNPLAAVATKSVRAEPSGGATVNSATPIRAIALVLPQYHPVAENDAWWGKGFTEWSNVVKAIPQFRGHYQPHVPADLGYYDLRLAETRHAQAEMARRYGLSGFCYYHYWFNGRRLLERPVNEILRTGEPDFPFCLCWANENWTRAWDGLDREVLVEQNYSEDDDRAHMRYLAEHVFCDPRYIRVDNKPVFVVYRSLRLPNVRRTTEVWREEAQRCGIGELYLCRFESFPEEHYDAADDGFDAAIEFQPDWAAMPLPLKKTRVWRELHRLGLSEPIYQHSRVWNYEAVVEAMLQKPAASYKRYPGITPAWDNTARKKENIGCIAGSTPELYEKWLSGILAQFVPPSPQENFLFINAWNEWAEGNHLEPDQRFGHAYLEATARALASRTGERLAPEAELLQNSRLALRP